MVVAKVIGEIVSTVKISRLIGQKFLLVEVMNIRHEAEGDKLVPTGQTIVANDPLGAGRNEIVMIVQGSSARMTDLTATVPTDGIVIGIIDSINVESKSVYNKSESEG